jgi:hypothetical protein
MSHRPMWLQPRNIGGASHQSERANEDIKMFPRLKPKEQVAPSYLEFFMRQLPLMDSTAWKSVNRNYSLRAKIAADCHALVADVDRDKDDAREAMHGILEIIYAREFRAPNVLGTDCEEKPILSDISSIFEQSMIESEVAYIDGKIDDYPLSGHEYVHWLRNVISEHRASMHPFYHDYLSVHGTCEDLKYLLAQETCLDPRFDDILALVQLGAKEGEKIELASNYWDEMGNGVALDMHSILFAEALNELGVTDEYIKNHYLFEAKVCGNLSAALALDRRHYYKAIGYYVVTEYLAPRRFRCLTTAWRRLGLSEKGVRYHELHVSVDAGHAAGWFRNVVQPAVDRDPRVGRDIMIGALLRLNTSARYLDAMLARTGFDRSMQFQGDEQ